MNKKEKVITIHTYNDFDSQYTKMPVKLQPDGHFDEIINEVNHELNMTGVIALIGCNYYGLDGLYTLHEKWLLIAPNDHAVKTITTLRYGRDFIGGLMTFIDEPYEKRSDPVIHYLLAFKGLDDQVNVKFYTPRNMAKEALSELMGTLPDRIFLDKFWQSNKSDNLNASTVSVDDQLQFVFAYNSGDSGWLFAHKNGEVSSILHVDGYYLFQLDEQLYLVTEVSGEGTGYSVYQVDGVHLNKVKDFGIACC